MFGALFLAGLAAAMMVPDFLSGSSEDEGGDDRDADMQDDETSDVLLRDDAPGPPASDDSEALGDPAEEAPEGVILDVRVPAGNHIVEDFEQDTDRLVIHVPEGGDQLELIDRDDAAGTPPMMRWMQDDGPVSLVFEGLESVPLGAISMQFAGQDEPMSLIDVMDAAATPAIKPADPEIPDTPPPSTDDDAAALAPVDPIQPDTEPKTHADDDESAVLRPVADPEWMEDPEPSSSSAVIPDVIYPTPDGLSPDDALAQDSETVDLPHPIPGDADPADVEPAANEPPEIIDHFTPGEDLLQIRMDGNAMPELIPAQDGSGTSLYVDGDLVAFVRGTTSLTLDDLVIHWTDSEEAA